MYGAKIPPKRAIIEEIPMPLFLIKRRETHQDFVIDLYFYSVAMTALATKVDQISVQKPTLRAQIAFIGEVITDRDSLRRIARMLQFVKRKTFLIIFT